MAKKLNDEESGSEEVILDNHALEQLLRTLCAPLRREKRKREIRRETEEEENQDSDF